MSTRCKVLTMNVGERLVTETCYSCGVLFAMVEDLYDHRLKDGKSFYCPNGHSQAYTQGKSDAQKLREAQIRETALQDQLSAAIRETESANSELLRIRSRIAVGVCPCCNRSFSNVRAHISTQHPELAAEASKARQQPAYRCSCGRRFDTWRGLRVHQGSQRRDGWDAPKAGSYRSHLTKV